MKLRYILRNNNDQDGLTKAIHAHLCEKFEVEKAVIINASAKGSEILPNDCEEIPITIFKLDSFDYDNKKQVLEPTEIEAMLPYKETAMHVMMRECHFDIYDRNFLEVTYYKMLEYWNYIISKYDINCYINIVYPHHATEYILYALCKVKKVRTIIAYPQIASKGISYHIGDAIENIGRNIAERYAELVDDDISKEDLNDFYKYAVNKVESYEVMVAGNKKQVINSTKQLLCHYASLRRGLLYLGASLLPDFVLKRKGDVKFYRHHYRRMFKVCLKCRKKLRKMDGIDIYNRLALKQSLDEKYIYFPLQQTPEASTLPAAGEFNNQLLSIQLLSEVAQKLGIYLYVKDHYTQPHRERGFYESIINMPNTKLISLEYNSLELIEKSVVVATQTGNCIFEALIKGKYAIVFGHGYTFKGAPNVIEGNSMNQMYEDIKSVISNKKKLKKEDIYRYVKAMGDKGIYLYTDSLADASEWYSREESAEKLAEFTKCMFISNG